MFLGMWIVVVGNLLRFLEGENVGWETREVSEGEKLCVGKRKKFLRESNCCERNLRSF